MQGPLSSDATTKNLVRLQSTKQVKRQKPRKIKMKLFDTNGTLVCKTNKIYYLIQFKDQTRKTVLLVFD